ncbi:hypothetical protein C4E22_04715 [ANME-1 cluster archaeon AG-394-G06]|nr:hypothetical protein [ANME-1 cluster archaeon AG-394-G06]
MGVMVGLLALIFVIFGAWGFTGIRYWKELRGEIEKNTNEAKKNAEEIEKDANEAKKSAEEAKKDADKANKAAEEAIDTFRERAKHLPSLSEPFSEDQKGY